MFGWIIAFLILAIAASIFGFGGLAGTFASIAQFLAVIFVILFLATLVYSLITGRKPNVPPV
jgi:uncharacterized membrane protein YtjA (UPF0391 family)